MRQAQVPPSSFDTTVTAGGTGGHRLSRHRTRLSAAAGVAIGVAAAVTLAAGPAMADTGLVANGGLSAASPGSSAPTSGFRTLFAGSTTLAGWTVVSGSVDWVTDWQSADGDGYSLDLSGESAGAVAQTLTTTPGATYLVQFDLAGNPAGGSTVKTLNVTAGGGQLQQYTSDTSTTSGTNMGWTAQGYTFTATNASTVLSFESMDNTPYGPTLDAVKATQIVASGTDCKNGGWAHPVWDGTSSSVRFKNQGQCVSSFATSGATPIG